VYWENKTETIILLFFSMLLPSFFPPGLFNLPVPVLMGKSRNTLDVVDIQTGLMATTDQPPVFGLSHILKV